MIYSTDTGQRVHSCSEKQFEDDRRSTAYYEDDFGGINGTACTYVAQSSRHRYHGNYIDIISPSYSQLVLRINCASMNKPAQFIRRTYIK